MADERRRDPRVRQTIPIRLAFGGVRDFLRAYTEDVSLGGVFVATQQRVPLGTKVDLTLEVEPGKGFRVEAIVAWQREAAPGQSAGVGLRFGKLQDGHKRWLDAAVAKHLKSQGFEADADAHQPVRHAGSVQLIDSGIDFDSGGDDTDGAILGIDLGTSNSCACLFDGEHYRLLDFTDDVEGTSHTMPSVVSYDDENRTLVGHVAVRGLEKNAGRTVFGAKRFIGRTYAHPDVQNILSRFPYKIVPDERERVAVEINGKAISLTQVAAKILEHIKVKGQGALRRPIFRAIVTVPAYYNQNQRDAVADAGRLAGLTVERVLNEPTAAAIAYGLTYPEPKTVLVYDLGGGTFDVSVMRISETGLTVLATAGDTFLGGEDFDEKILTHVCAQFEQRSGERLSRNHRPMAIIKAAVEKAKKRLSLHEKTMVMVRKVLLQNGDMPRLEVEIDRETTQGLVGGLVKRTLAICDLALADAKIDKAQLEEVLLVGGQTQMPYVREQVAKHFGRAPRFDLRPEEAVALGAGMLAHLRHAKSPHQLNDTLPMSIGLDGGNGKFDILIPRNTPIPHQLRWGVKVPAAKLKDFSLDVYQGDGTLLEAEYLGKLRANDLPNEGEAEVQLEVDFILTADCLLQLRLRNKGSGQEIDVLLDTRTAS